MKLKKHLLLSAFILASIPLKMNALPIDHGYYSTDVWSGLDWLDTTQTAGISYRDIRSGHGGWQDQGWRLATYSEVSDFFTRYVGTGSEDWFSGPSFDTSLQLIRQIGVNISFNNPEGVSQIYGGEYPTQISIDAYFDDGTSNNKVGIGELIARISGEHSNSTRWVAYSDHWYDENIIPNAGFGSFLVRQTSPVPEPSTLALLLSGLFVFIGFSRRCT